MPGLSTAQRQEVISTFYTRKIPAPTVHKDTAALIPALTFQKETAGPVSSSNFHKKTEALPPPPPIHLKGMVPRRSQSAPLQEEMLIRSQTDEPRIRPP